MTGMVERNSIFMRPLGCLRLKKYPSRAVSIAASDRIDQLLSIGRSWGYRATPVQSLAPPSGPNPRSASTRSWL
jgi:hypothetical protein